MDSPIVRFKNLTWRPSEGVFRLGPLDGVGGSSRFIALVGPNGAGKSTLLNLIGGLMKPDCGQVSVFGQSPTSMKSRERGRRIAFLSQDPERPFGFGVREYAALGRFPANGPFRGLKDEDRDIINGELKTWGLDGLADRPVTSLSGGEYQRVRLARSLCQQPGLLLLDEPGNHLDLSSRAAILERLKQDARQGRCIIAVLHDVNDALLFADEAWLMNGGRLVASGKPGDTLNPDILEKVYGRALSRFKSESGSVMLGPEKLSRS